MKSKIHENQKSYFESLSKRSIIILGLVLGVYSTNVLAKEVKFNLFKKDVIMYDHSPICNAIIKGDIEAVKKFIQYGVNINEMSNGVTPLMLAARYNNVEIVKLLLENGADRRLKDEKGFDALKYAEMSKAADALEVLMRA